MVFQAKTGFVFEYLMVTMIPMMRPMILVIERTVAMIQHINPTVYIFLVNPQADAIARHAPVMV